MDQEHRNIDIGYIPAFTYICIAVLLDVRVAGLLCAAAATSEERRSDGLMRRRRRTDERPMGKVRFFFEKKGKARHFN